MQIRSLEHFIALSKAGSFYRAAQRNELSVQGFAKMLSSFEAELGVELAVRSRSGISLTPAGEALLEDARYITERWSLARSRLDTFKQEREEDSGRFKVFTTHYGMQVISKLEYIQQALSSSDLYEESFDVILLRAQHAEPNEIFIADLFSDAVLSELSYRGIAFECIFESVLGLIVNHDCSLAQVDAVSVSDIGALKMSNYLHKEWSHLVEKTLGRQAYGSMLFKSTAFNMLIDFVKAAPDHGILSDSLSAYVMRNNPVYNTSDLRFVPLYGNKTRLRLGVLYRQDQESTSQTPIILSTWRKLAQMNSSDYFSEFTRLNHAI